MDVVRFIDKYVHSQGDYLMPLSFHSFKAFLATAFYDIVQLSQVMGGVFLIAGAYVCWTLYKEATTGETPESGGSVFNNPNSERAPLLGRDGASTFKAFEGMGNKL